MARIAWLQDLCPWEKGGGAQLTDRAHIGEGIIEGHTVDIYTPNTEGGLRLDSDLFLISNASSFNPGVLADLAETGRTCWFLHDYWPVCKWRLFYPMQERCRTCQERSRWVPIIRQARLLIWLSPLHRESWLWQCPELADVPYALIPSPVSTEEFFDMHEDREGVICIESLFPFKGRANVVRWAEEHPDIQVSCLGGNPSPEPLPPNMVDLGYVPYYDLNNLLNRHRSLLHLPVSPSPFDRTTVEAYLAGCSIIHNGNVGALSYDWFRSASLIKHHMKSSPLKFWDAIEHYCLEEK
jgi:hypothetical protein